MRRREFLSAAAGATVVPIGSFARAVAGGKLGVPEMKGGVSKEAGKTPISNAAWYVAGDEGDGLVYRMGAGALARVKYIAADMLLDGDNLVLSEQWTQSGKQWSGVRRFARLK